MPSTVFLNPWMEKGPCILPREIIIHVIYCFLWESGHSPSLTFLQEIWSLDKTVRAWDAYSSLEGTVKDMTTSLRAIAELQSPALRDRHWQQLMKAVGVRTGATLLCSPYRGEHVGKSLVSIRRSSSLRHQWAHSSFLSDLRKSRHFFSLGLVLLLSWERFCLLFKHHSCPVRSHREEIGQHFTATKEELGILCTMERISGGRGNSDIVSSFLNLVCNMMSFSVSCCMT